MVQIEIYHTNPTEPTRPKWSKLLEKHFGLKVSQFLKLKFERIDLIERIESREEDQVSNGKQKGKQPHRVAVLAN